MLWGPRALVPPSSPQGLWAPQAEPQGCLAGQPTGWGGLDRIPTDLPPSSDARMEMQVCPLRQCVFTAKVLPSIF